jgi:hypothetical protein
MLALRASILPHKADTSFSQVGTGALLGGRSKKRLLETRKALWATFALARLYGFFGWGSVLEVAQETWQM